MFNNIQRLLPPKVNLGPFSERLNALVLDEVKALVEKEGMTEEVAFGCILGALVGYATGMMGADFTIEVARGVEHELTASKGLSS